MAKRFHFIRLVEPSDSDVTVKLNEGYEIKHTETVMDKRGELVTIFHMIKTINS